MTPESEEILIKRIKNGEYSLYKELVLAYQDRLYLFILKLVHNEDDASDICQESLFKGYKNLSKFRFKSKFSTWLFQIAYNNSITWLKKKSKESNMELKTELKNDVFSDQYQHNHTDDIEKKELSEMINNALNSLRSEYRLAIHLFYSNENSYSEIAGIMGIPINSVKSHLRRGKEMLRNILKDEYRIEDYTWF
ncbi:MAG: sigma-70 family RNA polymerase sigma factor [bacterium]|nr:sigma-70 family RNA polymerase sigma factor [bacterium]